MIYTTASEHAQLLKNYETLINEITVCVHVIGRAGRTIIYNQKMTGCKTFDSLIEEI
ncbi:hypothetical protein [Alkalihalobacterium alkalinitrilicum]|uniref:hypothetical protein n=1 Tax=Alkalihalobacterium alkalinitrilicum TaxID=427920 RepID=UPI001303EBE7|nr:hypothetical protein [Alkalihalobacterium alkalinitrilicum]